MATFSLSDSSLAFLGGKLHALHQFFRLLVEGLAGTQNPADSFLGCIELLRMQLQIPGKKLQSLIVIGSLHKSVYMLQGQKVIFFRRKGKHQGES